MWERYLNALMAIIIAAILFGALAIQFFKHEQPCPLCLLQRLGMLGVASGALLNVRFKIAKIHYGLSLISAVFGGFVALRHFFLHVCPTFSTFGKPFWGLSLYTWSFIIFSSSVLYIAILLICFNQEDKENKTFKHKYWWGQLAFIVIFLVALINIVTTFLQCGLTVCSDV